ncbi:PSCyt1 domain-containing protein [Gammaproteobacteria bacterium]
MNFRLASTYALITCVWLTGCNYSSSEVSYTNDIRPILIAYCLECHNSNPPGKGFSTNLFSVENYNSLMRGTKYGVVIIPGNPASSTLIRAVEGKVHERLRMPYRLGPLPQRDATLIHQWVAQGAQYN